MKHLELPQSPKTKLSPNKAKDRKSSVIKFALAGLIFVLAAGYGMSTFWGAEQADRLSPERKAELVAEFGKIRSIRVSRVEEKDVEKALDTMRLAPDARRALHTTLSASTASPTQRSSALPTPSPAPSPNKTILVWLTLWDSVDADGDAVHISSAGYETDVLLQKSPQRIAVPVDANAAIRVTGVHDGRGGITLGIQSGTSSVMLPVLAPGQVFTLPVSY